MKNIEKEIIAINNKKKNEIKTISNIIHKKIFIYKDSLHIKSIFREYRTLKTISKKSEYLIELKDIKLINNNNNFELDFIFQDEGIDLYSLINSEIFDYKNQHNLIKWILFQILKGLETLHSLNIIHRDINPHHILISSKGGIKIIGFGRSITEIEAKFLNDKVVGNLSYIAPECLALQNFSYKIDIWAVGVLMLELYYKKTNFLISPEDNPKENLNIRFFKQLKYLSNFFNIPFNFNEKNIQKENLISWLNDAKIEKENFDKIFKDIPDLDDDGLNLLRLLLTFDPKKRCTAKEALKMNYFKEYQNFNQEENPKKNKIKDNENISIFLKNLEKEFQKIDAQPEDLKMGYFKKEIIKIFQNESIKSDNI